MYSVCNLTTIKFVDVSRSVDATPRVLPRLFVVFDSFHFDNRHDSCTFYRAFIHLLKTALGGINYTSFQNRYSNRVFLQI